MVGTRLGILALVVVMAGSHGADYTADFAGGVLDGQWQVKGDAQPVADHGGCLQVGPGARAVRLFRDQDGAGEVSFRVLDNGGKAAKPRDRVSGASWGVITKSGQVLVVGALYAPYLKGEESYALTDYAAGETPYARIRYLGIRRDAKWHTWTFRFDPDQGASILYDGRDINGRTQRFDWNQSKMPAFAGIVLLGDATPDKNGTIWVDDVSATLGPPMRAVPTPPPPPPPVTPASDPAADQVPAVVESLRGRHPRLLFTPEEIPALRERAQGVSQTMMKSLENYVPACQPPTDTKYQTDATDGQRQGLWRLPTISLHYVLTGNPDSLARAQRYLELFAAADHWETGEEEDSGMSSANIMVGVAIGYDLLWNELAPEFREQLRAKLLLMARRQYYRGHLAKAKGIHYWQGDPANNHRWHRDAGLSLAVCAIAGDGPGDEWLRERTVEELQFVHDWLPEDGSSHESPSYLIFGLSHLVLAFDACDRVFGTDLMAHPFFRETVGFRLQTLCPGFTRTFGFGDSGEEAFGGYHPALWRCLGPNGNPAEYELLRQFAATKPDAFEFGWQGLVWHQPPTGESQPVPLVGVFPDLGLVCLRDGWDENSVALSFKCGPLGGGSLNRFRNAETITGAPFLANTGPLRYINVAHDDPDANSFMLYAHGRMVAKDDGYAYHKQTASHNTLLINDQGQVGGGHWSQPVKGVDMTTLARLVGVTRLPKGGVIAEGEAGASYIYAKGKSLTSFRRLLIWQPGDYVLTVDSILAPEPVTVTWLAQSRTAEATGNQFALADGDVAVTGALAASAPLDTTVVDSSADQRGRPLGYRQVQASAKSDTLLLAAVLDPWQRGSLAVSMTAAGTVEVKGPFGTDCWQVTVPDPAQPATVQGTRNGTNLLP